MVNRNSVFRRCFFALWLIGLLLLCVRMAVLSHEDAQRRTERLLQSAERSAAQTVKMSTQARQIASTFDMEAIVVLLDAQGNVLTQTQEFLLLRGDAPRLALLSDLTAGERALLYEAAASVLSEADLSHAAAFAVEYPYGDVVYPNVESGRTESLPVTTPVSLLLKPTDAADVWQATLSEDGAAYDAWLPYLRSEDAAQALDRLLELTRGTEPRRSLLRWEHFRMEPAPAGLDAAYLAAYQASCPLWDTLRSEGWMLLVYPLLAAFCSAALALAAERIWRGLRSKERA